MAREKSKLAKEPPQGTHVLDDSARRAGLLQAYREVRDEQASKELPSWLIRAAMARTYFNVGPRPPMSTKLVIAGLVATIALAMLGCWLGGEEASRGRCEGILHQDDNSEWIGGEKGWASSLCIFANSEAPKVRKVCAGESYCVVVGRAEDCKDTPGCTRMTNVISVTMRTSPGQP